MSFRHTYITEFLYKNAMDAELADIEKTLESFGSVTWQGKDGLGYFHGVFKDYNGYDMEKGGEGKAIIEALEKLGIKIKIVYES